MRSSSPRAHLAVASTAVLLTAADTYVVVLALTDMMAGVGLGIESLHRATPIVSGFLVGYVATLPLIGRLADLVSRRQALGWCLLVFTVGSVITALASDLGVLVAGRVIQGVGGGGLVPATLALVADQWPPERRGAPLGVVGAVQELGAVAGPGGGGGDPRDRRLAAHLLVRCHRRHCPVCRAPPPPSRSRTGVARWCAGNTACP
ncbi:MAG: MFS transporter [Dermatophilaceae bacterium]